MSKRRGLLLVLVLGAVALVIARLAMANVTVTPASGGTGISADKAQNATSPAWTTLGNIVIAEGSNGDFANQSGTTLILTAPAGFRFNTAAGTVSFTASKNISSATLSVAASTLTVTLTVSGTNKTDTLTISGVQVQSTDGANVPAVSGNILRTAGNPGTATIAGIVNGTTNFGSLSQVNGAVNKLGFNNITSPQTAGTAFAVTVRSQDQFGNPVNVGGATDTNFAVSLNTGTGTLGGTLSGTITIGTNSGVLTGVTYTKAAEPSVILTAAWTSGGTALNPGNSNSFTVVAGALDHFLVEKPGGGPIVAQTAGTSFSVQVTAQDVNNNTVTGFTGAGNTVDITSTGTLSAGGGTTATFTSGVLASHAVTISNTGNFTITATRTSGGTQAGTSTGFDVDAGPLDHFLVDKAGGGPIGPQTAGTSFNVRVTAQDALNNTVPTFGGTVDISSTGTLSAGGGTTATFSGGVLASHSVTISNTGTFTITATRTSGGTQTGTSGSFAVGAGALDHFKVEKAGGGSIGTQTAGTSFDIQVTAQDVNNNTVGGFTGTVDITSTGTLSAGGGTTPAFSGGVLASRAVTISNTGSFTITATRTSGGSESGTSASFTVNPGALNNFLVEKVGGGAIGSQTAGTNFNIQVTARDANNNTVTGFTGTVDITSTGTLQAGSGTTAAFSTGVLASHTVRISNTGSFTITATRTSGGSESGTSASFTVNPGALNNFLVEAQGGGAIGTQTAGTSFDIKITALDSNNNTVTGFTGTVDLTSTGTLSAGGGTTPAFTAGVLASRTVTISNTGSFTITATKTSGSEAGTSNAFTVNPGALANFLVDAAGGGAIGTQTAGTSFDIRITARDANNNTVTGFTGTVDITSTGTLSAGGGTTPAFTAGVLASRSVTISNTGLFSITATKTSGSETGNSGSFTVNPGVATKLAITAVPGTVAIGANFSVTVQSQDANGNPSNVVAATGISLSGSGSGTFTGNTDTIAAGTNTKTLSTVTYDTPQTITLTASRTSGDALAASAASSSIVFKDMPSSSVTFPNAGGNHNAAAWAAGCATAGYCGTATDNSGTGLAGVDISIRQGSGNYWDGSGFNSGTEQWLATSLAGSNWSYGFASTNFPANGSYTIRVRARDNLGGQQAPPLTRTFTYDNAAPATAVTSPASGGFYRTATWVNPAGTASDTGGSGLQRVEVSVRRVSTGLYWNGTTFTDGTENWRTPTGAASWSLSFAASDFPADGDYVFRVRSVDNANNTESALSYTITYDTTAPAAPSITSSTPVSPANNNAPKLLGSAESGSTVKIYTDVTCTGAVAASGPEATFASPGLTLAVSDDTTTNFRATATDAAGNVSACSAAQAYVEDSTAPAAPSISSSNPVSPANNNSPKLLGSAESGSTVKIYTDATCTGAVAASGPEATFASPGLTLAVSDDTATNFRATATDAAGNVSACSSAFTYVEDSTAPVAPSGLSTSPASPANDNSPKVLGSAEAGSTAKLYTSSDCSGAPVATGAAATFATPGFSVTVSNDSSTTFKATATDAAGNTSTCSTGVTYVEDSTAPAAPTTLASSPAGPANDNNPEITGSAEGGSTAKLFLTSDCSGAPVASGSAASFTSPGLTVAVSNDSTTTVKATATDAAGNESSCSTGVSYVEDSTAPAAPTGLSLAPTSPANDNNPKVSGSAEAGSTVKLYTSSDCSGAPVVSGSAASFSSPGLTAGVADDSSTTFKATATDAAGNPSGCSSGVAYTEDSSAPAAPSGLLTTPASPANDNAPKVAGSAEAGSTVKLYTSSDCSGAPAATGGAAAFATPGLAVAVSNDSTTTFKATATDAAGNTSGCSTGVTYVEDSTAPTAPSSLGTTPASPANNNSPNVTGSAEAGSTVKLFATSDCSGAPAASGSAVSFAAPGLAVSVSDNSTATHKATATDAAGNTSACSTGVAYTEDSTAPAAPSITSSSPASPANDNNPELIGSAEAGSTVKLYTDATCTGAVAASGPAATFGGAGITAAVSNDTTTSFRATATDAAGNVSGCSSALTYVEDSTAPAAPSISSSNPASPANNNSPKLIGSAEAGSTVKIYTDATCTGAVAASGSEATFSGTGVTVAVSNDSSTSFRATATDAAGNVSGCSSALTYVEDSTAPSVPSALSSSPGSPANDNNPELTGSAEGGSTVKVYTTSDCSGAAAATGTAAAFATPGLTVSVSNDTSTAYYAAATDAAGNVSGCSSGYTYVEDSTAPAAPSIASSSPASPANDNNPELGGSAEAGSTVKIYTASDCSGGTAATGSAATFAGAGLTVSVGNDSSTSYYATATDAAGNASGCSSPALIYAEDSTAPATPSGLGTVPASRANNNSPKVTGSAEAGSTVKLYTTSDCSGAAAATGSAATFSSPGITAAVSDDTSTTFKATATDAAGNVSSCSSGVAYVEDSTAPAAPSTLSSSPGSPANDNNPELTGSAEAGSTVKLYTSSDCSGAPVATGSAASFATPGFTVAVSNDTSTTFKATATDAAGNTSSCSSGYTFVEDSTAPSAPSALSTTPGSPANDNSPKVSGTAEAGSTVKLYTTSDCSGAAAATGAAASFGSPGLTVSAANDSSTTFQGTATDAAGNTSACSSGVTYVEDSTAPAAPSSLGTTPASPANDNNPNVTGSAEAGSTVKLYTTSDCSGAPAASGSAATFAAPGIARAVANDSSTTWYATATDAAGNISTCSSGVTYVEDSTAPAAPSTLSSTPGSPANNNSPAITGTAEAGATAKLYTSSDCSGAPAASGTAASFATPGVTVSVSDDTSTTFKATATDAAGNASVCSSGYAFVEDSSAPAAPSALATTPASPANNNNPNVTGTAEAGSTVKLYTTSDCSGAPAATGTAAAFSSPGLAVSVSNDTTTTYKATATDAAGNTSGCSSGVTYVEDSTAPAAPSALATTPASPANNNNPNVTGTAEAGSTVKLYTSSDCSGAAAATGSAGAFSSPGLAVSVSNDTTTTYKATATDAAGNTSACSADVTYVEDSTAPAAPSSLGTAPASPANNNSPNVTGTAEAGSTVKLYTTSDCSGAPAASGSAATFASPGIARTVSDDTSSTWYTTATDAAGNASTCSSGVTYVEDSTAPAAPSGLSSSPASPANDNSPKVAGAAESGSSVKLYTSSDCSGAPVTTGGAAAFGSPGLTVAVADDSTTTFKATATDAAGNTSGCSTGVAYTEDSTAPSAPGSLSTTPASPANNNNPRVIGGAEAGSTVKVFTSSDCSGAPVATGGAGAFATPGLTAAVGNDSTTTFKATATDAAGNTSGCSAGVTYVEDSTAPAAPSALNSSPGSPANDNSPELTGSAEAGSTVKVFSSSDCSGAPVASGSAGSFATPGLTVAVANDSTTTYKATATDAAGNESSCSSGYTYVEDSTAPVAPSSLGTAPASPANDNSPKVTGNAEAGSTVKVYTSSDCSGATAATGSAANFSSPGLAVSVSDDSTTSFKATATDAAGNTSACSSGAAYVEDSTVPSSSTTFPANGQSYNASAWNAGCATNGLCGSASDVGSGLQRVEVSIKRESNGQYWNGSSFASGSEDWQTATGTSSWSYAHAAASFPADGNYTVRVRARDNAGNLETPSSRTFTIDTQAPADPSGLASTPGSPANDNAPKLTGTAEAGSSVKLYSTADCSGAPTASGAAAAFGGAGITVSVSDDTTTTLKATATDVAGNVSGCSAGFAYVEDSSAPAAPSGLASAPASPANDNNPKVSGMAEAGSTVKLYTTSDCSGAPVATGGAAAFASPGFAVPVSDNSSTTYKATATDASGNVSGCSAGLPYVEDSTAPAVPSSLGTTPASPANNNNPKVNGSAEAGSAVKLYTSSDCSGAPAATGTAAAFSSPGLTFSVADDTTTTFKATATDAAGNVSGCSTGVTYSEDSTAPAAPSALSSSPASPANDNDPELTGTAEAGSTVKLYTSSDCSGAPVTSGSAASFATPGLTVSVANDSSTTYKATATDAAGNTSGCSTGLIYVEDSTAPGAPSALSSTPVSPANDNSPKVSGSAEAGSTVKLYTSSDCSGAAAATGTAGSFTSTGLAVSVPDDSSTTYKATATDAAGNVSGCSTGIAYVEDSTAPAAPSALSTTPASPANDNSPSVMGTAEAGATVKLYTSSDCSGVPVATGGSAAFGGAGLSVSVADDSTTAFKATATDAAGNASGCSTGVTYVEDSSAPAAPSGLGSTPASPANDNTPKLTGTAEAGSTVKLYTSSDCSGAPVASGLAATFNGAGITVSVADNSSTTLKATATDAAGNVSGCSTGFTYVEDSAAPATPSGLSSTPASPANDNSPKVSGSAEAGSTVKLYTSSDCSGAAAATGAAGTFASTGVTVAVGDDSSSTFKATATDAAGNVSSCSTGVAYVEDSTAPSSITSFPANTASYNTGSWNAGCSPSGICGSASDAGAGLDRVEVSVRRDGTGNYWNGSGFSSATEVWNAATGTSSWRLDLAASSFPSDGAYTVRVRARDNAGNVEADASRTFTIDTGAPNTTIDSGPADPTSSQDPTFAFSASESGATYECRLDSGSWASCSSPKGYTGLAEGSHTFDVRATDGAGNTDATPASQTWRIDRSDPTSAFTFPAAGGFYNATGWQNFAGTASDSGLAGLDRVELSIRRVADNQYWNGSAFSSTTEVWNAAAGTTSWSLAFAASSFPADGDYAVRARARDNAGNLQAPIARNFTVDTVAPETTIDSAPANPINSTNADFTFSADQPGSTFECHLDSGSWASCSNPKNYTGLAQGSHTFEVRATDVGNNTDATPAARTWVVDTVPPVANMDNPGAYHSGVVSLTASATDTGGTGIASTAFQKSGAGAGSWSPVPASWTTTAADDGLYDFRVVATDNAGNSTQSTPVSNIWVDNTAPNAVIDDPGANVSGTVTLTDSSTDASSGIASKQFEYRSLPGGSFQSTPAAWNTIPLADGQYEVRVVVTDRAGNTAQSPAKTTRVDNTAPVVAFTAPLDGGSVNSTAADPYALAASATDPGSGVKEVEFYYCTAGGASCTSSSSLGIDNAAPYQGSWPLPGADGPHSLKVVARDNVGHSASAIVTVTIDRAVPDTNLITYPGNPSNVATPQFTFSSTEPGSFECRVDGGSWAGCSSPYTAAALADGNHTFEVRAIDAAGNVDGSPASWTWLLDATPPTATMNDPGPTLRGAITLSSSQADTGGSGIATVEYQYSVANADTWVGTISPWDTTLVNDDLYDVHVVVTDVAGNVTESAPVEDRRVDNTPPETAIDDPGANVRSTITLRGSASDTGSGVQRVDFQISPTGVGSWTTVGSATGFPYEVSFDTGSFADGIYDFRTVATDVAGNLKEGTPVVGRRIDNTPPTASMNDPGANLRGAVNLGSVSDDAGGSGVSTVVYEALIGSTWTSISQTWATTSVPDGLYDLHVVVTDLAGNQTISAPVTGRRVDNTKPSTSDNAPAGWQASGVTVTLSASDSGSGVANTQYSVDGGGYASGSSVSISSDGIHTISYFSTDVVGNIESPKTATVMIDTTPPDPGANDPGNYLRGTVTLSANPDAGTGGAQVTEVEFQRSPAGANTWTQIGLDNTGPGPYTAGWVTTPADDGSWDLRFIVRDETGRETTVDMPSKIVDNTAPTGSIGSPLAGSTVSGTVNIGVTASDANPIASVEFFVRGSSIGTSSAPPFQRSWNSASGPDGSAGISAVITDMAGNSTSTGTVGVSVDNFAPAISLSSPGSTIRGTVTLGASADSDVTQVTFERRTGGGGWSNVGVDTGAPWSADFDTTGLNGSYELRAIAVDAGANSSISNTVTTLVDNTNPTGLLTRPNDGANVGGNVALEATASDSGSGVGSVTWEARPAGGSFSGVASDSSAPYAASWNAGATGTYELRLVVADVAGNTFTTNPITIDVDATPPGVTLGDPGSPLSGTVSLSAATTGDATSVTFGYSPAGSASWSAISTDGSAPYTANFNTTNLGDGVYDLRAIVSDALGNTAQSVRAGIRVDNFVPIIVLSVPANGSIVASANSVTITSSEDIAALTGVEFDGAPAVAPVVSGKTATFNTGALVNGSHTLTGTVRDAAGKTSAFSISFVIGVPAPAPDASGELPGALDLAPVPAPANFHGVVESDGTLTLRWDAAKDADGAALATVLFVDGIATRSLAPGEEEVNLGPFDPADMRFFSIAAVDGEGHASTESVKLRSSSNLVGKSAEEASAILANRGFEVGAIRGVGSVVVKPQRAVMSPLGSKIDLELGEAVSPQTKLVFNVVGTKKFSWSQRKFIALRVQTTRPSQVTATLLSPKGERVYHWRFKVKAGSQVIKLTMPPQVRRPGKYRLVLTIQSGSETVRRTMVVEIVGRNPGKVVTPDKRPVEIVLAGNSHIRRDIALGLEDEGMRVVAAVGDDTWDVAGDSSRNVKVLVIDVDRYGVDLVRDLRTVFPSVAIIALTNDPRRLAQSIRAGATVAVPSTTPPKDLAKLIERLAKRR